MEDRSIADADAAGDEYEAGESIEAVVAHDADKLECLVQAVEYREAGYRQVQPWIDSSLVALKTESARRLAEQALRGDILSWQRPLERRDISGILLAVWMCNGVRAARPVGRGPRRGAGEHY